jgi:hypothetical protein
LLDITKFEQSLVDKIKDKNIYMDNNTLMENVQYKEAYFAG